MALFINILALLSAFILISSSQVKLGEAKRSRFYAQIKCQQEECDLQPSHFALFSTVRRALESGFDLNGKEILPFIRATDILNRRFLKNHDSRLNGSDLVQKLLSNETLLSALKVFDSDDGKALINLYRSSVNGKDLNLACSQQRVQDLAWASKKLQSDSSGALDSYFGRIHRNFVKKSAKKCLKSSCNTIDKSMSKLDSILGKNQVPEPDYETPAVDENKIDGGNATAVVRRREFEKEELELCRFFKRSNETSCEIGGQELNEIHITKDREEENRSLLQAYYTNRVKVGDRAENQKELEEAARAIQAQCRPMKELLDYHLIGLRWYREHNLIEEQRFTLRTLWCPSLSYWFQVDRLCSQLLSYEVGNPETFAYEVTTSKQNESSKHD